MLVCVKPVWWGEYSGRNSLAIPKSSSFGAPLPVVTRRLPGLRVAMHHQILMGAMHRAQHGSEQLQFVRGDAARRLEQ